MHTIRATPIAGLASRSRRLLVVVLWGLLLGALLTPHVATDRIPITGDVAARASTDRAHKPHRHHGTGKQRAHRQHADATGEPGQALVTARVAGDYDEDGPADPVGTDTDSDHGVGD